MAALSRAAPRGWTALAGIVAVSGAWAAGGHHAVDDAAIMEPGNCKVESWITNAQQGERLLHAGTGCRVGPLELNGSAEATRQAGSSDAAYALQAKWATKWLPTLSAGVSLTTTWQAHSTPHYQDSAVVGLLSWYPRDDLATHLNLGRDFVHRRADQDHSGVSVEWKAHPDWTIVGERYRQQGTDFARAGVRWAISDAWSLDLTRAQRLRGAGASNWTLGANWQFARR